MSIIREAICNGIATPMNIDGNYFAIGAVVNIPSYYVFSKSISQYFSPYLFGVMVYRANFNFQFSRGWDYLDKIKPLMKYFDVATSFPTFCYTKKLFIDNAMLDLFEKKSIDINDFIQYDMDIYILNSWILLKMNFRNPKSIYVKFDESLPLNHYTLPSKCITLDFDEYDKKYLFKTDKWLEKLSISSSVDYRFNDVESIRYLEIYNMRDFSRKQFPFLKRVGTLRIIRANGNYEKDDIIDDCEIDSVIVGDSINDSAECYSVPVNNLEKFSFTDIEIRDENVDMSTYRDGQFLSITLMNCTVENAIERPEIKYINCDFD